MKTLDYKTVLYIPESKARIADALIGMIGQATSVFAEGTWNGEREAVRIVTVLFGEEDADSVLLTVAIAISDLLHSGEESVLLSGLDGAVLFDQSDLPELEEAIIAGVRPCSTKEKGNATLN